VSKNRRPMSGWRTTAPKTSGRYVALVARASGGIQYVAPEQVHWSGRAWTFYQGGVNITVLGWMPVPRWITEGEAVCLRRPEWIDPHLVEEGVINAPRALPIPRRVASPFHTTKRRRGRAKTRKTR
jgi:hypothetical protein